MFDTETIRAFGEAVVGILAIVNPIGNLPIFVGLTEDASVRTRRRVFRLAALASLLIVVAMALAGQFLLHDVFHIGMQELAFGGGLILIVIGIRSILISPAVAREAVEDEEAMERRQMGLAISPIASPLLVGPGCIVTVMLTVQTRGHLFGVCASLAAFAIVAAILTFSHVLYRLIGRLVALAIGRVMQIFIVAIGAKFCFASMAEVFPGLVR